MLHQVLDVGGAAPGAVLQGRGVEVFDSRAGLGGSLAGLPGPELVGGDEGLEGVVLHVQRFEQERQAVHVRVVPIVWLFGFFRVVLAAVLQLGF